MQPVHRPAVFVEQLAPLHLQSTMNRDRLRHGRLSPGGGHKDQNEKQNIPHTIA